ncbi:hypothetical protein BGZ91_005563 [Linnemannia elongata]|nr:hypothetical protein BGZ91_005563 [Linnemannia elongata]
MISAQLGGCRSSEDGEPWSISITANIAGQGACHFPSPIPSLKGSGTGCLKWVSQGMTGTDMLSLSFETNEKSSGATLSGTIIEGKFKGKAVVLKVNIDEQSIPEIAAGCLFGRVRSVAIRFTSFTIDD